MRLLDEGGEDSGHGGALGETPNSVERLLGLEDLAEVDDGLLVLGEDAAPLVGLGEPPGARSVVGVEGFACSRVELGRVGCGEVHDERGVDEDEVDVFCDGLSEMSWELLGASYLSDCT